MARVYKFISVFPSQPPSLPFFLSRNSDPGTQSMLFSPLLPTSVRAFHFNIKNTLALSPLLVDSHRSARIPRHTIISSNIRAQQLFLCFRLRFLLIIQTPVRPIFELQHQFLLIVVLIVAFIGTAFDLLINHQTGRCSCIFLKKNKMIFFFLVGSQAHSVISPFRTHTSHATQQRISTHAAYISSVGKKNRAYNLLDHA